jgi:uncharacterized membrane protein YbjE (DUF340 family)
MGRARDEIIGTIGAWAIALGFGWYALQSLDDLDSTQKTIVGATFVIALQLERVIYKMGPE